MIRFLFLFCLCTAALAGEPVSIRLPWKHQFEFAALYAAEAQGYYREAGLDVRILEGGPGIDTTQEVVEGRADFGIGASSLVLDRQRGKPVVALATLMQHSPIALLARRAEGLASVHDLADRPIAVDPHSRDEIEAFLRASGIARDRIRLIDQTDWTLEQLDRGEEAAKIIYLSNEPFLIRGREHEYLIFTPRSAGIDLFGNMLFTREEVLKKRPEVVKAFREATLKGLVYALDHPREIAQYILEQCNSQQKTLEHLLFEAAQMRELTRTDIVEPGYMSPGRWRHVVEVYASQGKMPADFPLEGFLYDPRPAAIPVWLLVGLAVSLLALLAALLVVAKVRGLNKRLKAEIKERRQAQEAARRSEARYRELVENANAVILRMDLEGRVTYFNEYAETLFGYTAEEMRGRHVVGSIVPEVESQSRRDLAALIDDLLRDPVAYADNENENITKDGRRIRVHWSNRVILDAEGRPSGVLCIGHDVTAQHHLELELAAYRGQLEEQVRERTAQLEASRAEAERLSRVKSEFLAHMSHEIRTPMNGVLGFAQIGLRQSSGREQARETFARIINAGKLLQGVIDDILDFSRLEAGRLKIDRAPCDLPRLLDDCLALFEERARAKSLTLTRELAPDLPHAILCDPLRLQQILVNLLGNAVKFTEHGHVTLAAGLDRHGRLAFSVRDSGIGMDAEQIARLFDPFTQADSSITRRYGGSGLGLAISQRLARLMEGEINVTSQPDAGSEFTLLLPWTPAPDLPAAAASADVEPRRLQGLRVLAAEDNEVNRMVLEDLLREEGCHLDLAEDGLQAVEAVRRAGPGGYDLVLMDVQMPVMNGLDATRAILAIDPELPVIGQTAHALADEHRNCRAAGMLDVLTKPLDPDALIALAAAWARRRVEVTTP